jgi:hypothetical protein
LAVGAKGFPHHSMIWCWDRAIRLAGSKKSTSPPRPFAVAVLLRVQELELLPIGQPIGHEIDRPDQIRCLGQGQPPLGQGRTPLIRAAVKRLFFMGVSSFILPRKFDLPIPLFTGRITAAHPGQN